MKKDHTTGAIQKIIFFLHLGVHLGREIPFAYAQSNLRRIILILGTIKNFREAFETIR
jgi:hypothetical protein